MIILISHITVNEPNNLTDDNKPISDECCYNSRSMFVYKHTLFIIIDIIADAVTDASVNEIVTVVMPGSFVKFITDIN